MSLLDDVCRCHDADCQVREQCRRWMERDSGGARTVHQFSLRPTWQCHDEFCDSAIPVQEGA